MKSILEMWVSAPTDDGALSGLRLEVFSTRAEADERTEDGNDILSGSFETRSVAELLVASPDSYFELVERPSSEVPKPRERREPMRKAVRPIRKDGVKAYV